MAENDFRGYRSDIQRVFFDDPLAPNRFLHCHHCQRMSDTKLLGRDPKHPGLVFECGWDDCRELIHLGGSAG